MSHFRLTIKTITNINFKIKTVSPKYQDREKHLERLLLKNFPYILSDNFDYTDSTKFVNQQV